jgi:hypothetical protein
MKAWVLRGSKQEIAEAVARMDGEVYEAIVFVEEPADAVLSSTANATTADHGPRLDIFADMMPFTVNVDKVDDSRDVMYGRMEGE